MYSKRPDLYPHPFGSPGSALTPPSAHPFGSARIYPENVFSVDQGGLIPEDPKPPAPLTAPTFPLPSVPTLPLYSQATLPLVLESDPEPPPAQRIAGAGLPFWVTSQKIISIQTWNSHISILSKINSWEFLTFRAFEMGSTIFLNSSNFLRFDSHTIFSACRCPSVSLLILLKSVWVRS